jgi:hypothetical protein
VSLGQAIDHTSHYQSDVAGEPVAGFDVPKLLEIGDQIVGE